MSTRPRSPRSWKASAVARKRLTPSPRSSAAPSTAGGCQFRCRLSLLFLFLFAAPPTVTKAFNVYYADLHAHTTLSDGIGTPAEAYTYARDVADIDVLALTEHTHLLTAAEFAGLLATANQYSQDGVFVALAAQEFGHLDDFGHINIYDALSRNPNSTADLPATYNFIQTAGALGCYNHPNPEYGSQFEHFQFYPQYAEAMKAIEVRNGLATRGYETEWMQALANGWKIGPFDGQDNEEGHWGDQGNPNRGGNIYLPGILAEHLTKREMVGALHARHFFAMEVDPPSDRMELDFRIDDQPMGSEVETDIIPHITATAHAVNGVSLFNRVELYKDGVICNTQVLIGNTIYYQYYDLVGDGEQHYYFVRIRQVDGNFCWSAPIWVTAYQGPAGLTGGEPVGGRWFLDCTPNPTHGGTQIRFVLPRGASNKDGLGSDAEEGKVAFASSSLRLCEVRLSVHDLTGRMVRDLGVRSLPPGANSWDWDGRDETGKQLPGGIYFCRLVTPGHAAQTGRLVLIH
jgi:hypothetical protein